MNCEEIIRPYSANGERFILEPDAYQICEAYGIPHPQYSLVQNRDEALRAAEQIGFPLVLKVVSPEVIHKSDVGGVIVGLSNKSELAEGYDRLLETVRRNAGDPPVRGVLVQRAMPSGGEVAVGGLKNSQFGPVVMFGSGGVLIEVYKDVSFRLAPLPPEEALRQIQETKAYQILQGVRGQQACDVGAVADLIVNTGKILSELEAIEEIDFNPVRVYGDGCYVLDARMKLKTSL